MKNSIIAAAIVIVVMSPAIAQNTTAKPTAAARPAANAPAAPIPVSDARPDASTPDLTESRANSDARVCLEFPTKMQIIKCSEKYRGTHVRHTGT